MKPANASKDFLTNCYVREGITPFLKKMEEEYLTHKKPFAVLITDVDHFKTFNDKYGHMYGDEVLKYFSSSLRLDLEDEENIPFRFGGDEFVVVFPNKGADKAFELAERLKKNIRTRSCLIKGKQMSVTFSGGIAAYPSDANTLDDVMEKADKALYYSKNHGRNRITKYSDLVHNEVYQISLVLAFLLIIGGSVYFFRDSLSTRAVSLINAAGSLVSRTVPKPASDTPASSTAAPQKTPAKPSSSADTPAQKSTKTSAPAKALDEIELEAGRKIKGSIKHEDDEIVEVEVTFKTGKGLIQIKKSQILHIKRASEEAIPAS